jgi:DNA-binding transcriptional MerR regulator
MLEMPGARTRPPTHAGFSLSALEELVAENERLAAACHARQQPATELLQLEARLRQLQLENDALRSQLQRSEGLRRKGVHALLGLQQVRASFKRPALDLFAARSTCSLQWR